MTATMAALQPPPVNLISNYESRGRALIATRTIKPGEIILTDVPILLYPSSFSSLYCFHCFLSLSSSANSLRCSSCSTPFCSVTCHSKSLSSTHTRWVCHVLSRLPTITLSAPQKDHVFFLIAAYNLAVVSPDKFRLLLSLHGLGDPSEALTIGLHSLLSSLSPPVTEFGVSLGLTADLLAKDKMNAFGLMERFEEGKEERGVRAYGVYVNAAFFNHDCLPNASRFDYLDREGKGTNTEIIVRAIHEISEGREVCLSYFPVNWAYKERQKRLLEEYGFECQCDRCLIEKNWKDEEEAMEEEVEVSGDDEGMENGEDEEEEEEKEDFPHAYFFVNFMCNRESCGGTLAPLPPSPNGTVSEELECNVCGWIRREGDVKEETDSEEGFADMMDD